jgi:hypothetical protein
VGCQTPKFAARILEAQDKKKLVESWCISCLLLICYYSIHLQSVEYRGRPRAKCLCICSQRPSGRGDSRVWHKDTPAPTLFGQITIFNNSLRSHHFKVTVPTDPAPHQSSLETTIFGVRDDVEDDTHKKRLLCRREWPKTTFERGEPFWVVKGTTWSAFAAAGWVLGECREWVYRLWWKTILFRRWDSRLASRKAEGLGIQHDSLPRHLGGSGARGTVSCQLHSRQPLK